MDVDVDVALNKQVVYALDILVLARVRRSKNRTCTESVFFLSPVISRMTYKYQWCSHHKDPHTP
jgi:hypothetical protein